MDAIAGNAAADLAILLQAVVAVVLGGVIGLEREWARKWAGLRTNILVCLAAFTFTQIGLLITQAAATHLPAELVEADPIRIVQAVVIGISFLGAGVIMREPRADRVEGLTTAATLLVVAPVGVLVALQHYVLAVGITLLTLFILRGLRRLEVRVAREA